MSAVGYPDSGPDQRDGPVLFETYVAENWDSLCRFAYLVTGNIHDAQDALQDALAGLWPRWDSVRLQGDPGAYLRRSISNARVSWWRRGRLATPFADVESVGPGAGAGDAAVLDSMVVAQVLRGLSARQRAVVVLRYLEDWSYADIAAATGCTEAAARSVVRHALAAMRETLLKEAS